MYKQFLIKKVPGFRIQSKKMSYKILICFFVVIVFGSCNKYYLYKEKKIPCRYFTKDVNELWEKHNEYYYFKNKKWDNFFYLFTYGGQQCLEGININRFKRIYGEPNEILGDSLIYHLGEECLKGNYCNVQIFEFHQKKLTKVHLVRPWGSRPIQ